jgi:hypothetical protein
MIEHVPQFGEVACSPVLPHGALRERWRFLEVVEIHAATLCLQPRPGPHVPPEAQIAFEIETGLPGLRVARVRIAAQERRRQCTEAAFDVGGKGRAPDPRNIDERAGLLGVETGEEGNVVMRPRNERFIRTHREHVIPDDRMADPACLATEQRGHRALAQCRDGTRAKRRGVLLAVGLGVLQQIVRGELQGFEQSAALTDGPVKQSFG